MTGAGGGLATLPGRSILVRRVAAETAAGRQGRTEEKK
jgi:hypothetical protein